VPDIAYGDVSLPETYPLATPAVLETISREIGETHARGHGRPPTSATTVWHEDVIVCVLEGVFTEAEREAVESGRFEWMRAERLARHEPFAPSFRALIETHTGRPVRAYMNEVGPEDVAFEAFVLAEG
jgi:uncharacterized protein YbcI